MVSRSIDKPGIALKRAYGTRRLMWAKDTLL